MIAKMVTTTFMTDKIDETREFYVSKLGARLAFDCGWYISLEFGGPQLSVHFMSPQTPAHKLSHPDGLTFNIAVENVDSLHEKLTAGGGIAVDNPLASHPWGDRGFGIKDPNGISLYFYTEIEPDEYFSKCFK